MLKGSNKLQRIIGETSRKKKKKRKGMGGGEGK